MISLETENCNKIIQKRTDFIFGTETRGSKCRISLRVHLVLSVGKYTVHYKMIHNSK